MTNINGETTTITTANTTTHNSERIVILIINDNYNSSQIIIKLIITTLAGQRPTLAVVKSPKHLHVIDTDRQTRALITRPLRSTRHQA
jgi:hypothetical protein